MKSALYLTALKLHLGINSDNGIAKLLGLSRAYIGNVKMGGAGFGNESAIKIAGLLGIHPAKVMADFAIDRASSPEERLVWREVAKAFDASEESEMHEGEKG